MSSQRPIQRHDQMTNMSATIAKNALHQLSLRPIAKVADDIVDIKSGRITFEKAAKLYPSMHTVGFDLYSIAAEDETIAPIWKKETVRDPQTGKDVDWLVAYTTDDDDIMRDVASSLKLASNECPDCGGKKMFGKCPKCDKSDKKEDGEDKEESEEKESSLHSVAAEPAKKNQAPIAPGVLNKNLTIDQSGQGGTAKVTVEFNDIAKGKEFFEKVEQEAGGAGGEEKAPALEEGPEVGAEEAEEATPAKPAKPATPAGPEGMGAPQGAGAPPPGPLASTIRNMTTYGQQMVTIKAEKCANYPVKHYYINELGERIDLTIVPKVGSKFNRPDLLGTMIRVSAIVEESVKSDDDDIIRAIAVDVADQVPPMNWTNKESQNEGDEGGNNGPLPANPALQQGQPPTSDTQQPAVEPLYDSNGPGTKPKFNMTVNPEDNSVTVKMDNPAAIDAIDNAVQGQQPPMGPATPPPQQGNPNAPQPMAGQPKNNFNESASPVSF